MIVKVRQSETSIGVVFLTDSCREIQYESPPVPTSGVQFTGVAR